MDRPRPTPPAPNDDGEAAGHDDAYRRRVRRISQAVIFALAGVLTLSALLRQEDPGGRASVLGIAAVVVASGLAWFTFVPPTALPVWRVFIATTIAQIVMWTLLLLTGGASSVYFPYYLLPVLVVLFAGETLQVLGLACIEALGLLALGPLRSFDDLATRLLELAMFAFYAVIATRVIATTRQTLAQRAVLLAQTTEQATRAAMTDDLTQLGNRRYLRERLDELAASGSDLRLAVVALDVDGLKAVNDKAGHAAGDAVLREIGRILRDVVRPDDMAVRTGGDEFLLVLLGADAATGRRVGERIARDVARIGGPTPISMSFGVAERSDGLGVSDLLHAADEDLYRSKQRR